MKLTIKLDIGEGPVTVETNLFITVLWERKYKRKASDLAQGVGAEDLAFMAHEAMKQAKITVPMMLDDFLKKIITLEVVDAETANPTQEAPTDAA
jgi:hypothetical protein